jgi:hypothetical protein
LDTSFSIHSGAIEVKLTGSEEFVKGQIKEVFAFIAAHSSTVDQGIDGSQKQTPSQPKTNSASKVSVNSVAAKLGVSKGTDLILAAAYRLTRDGQASFKRDALLEEMKQATNYYKGTYTNNLTSYLKTLMGSQKLLEQSTGNYALHADAMKDLEQKLA